MWQIPIPGNPPTVREIRSKDHVASWKTWITRIVKNSSTAEILPELSCVVLDLSLPQQSFKSVSALLVSHCICLELGCLRALRIKWCEKIWERKCGSAETMCELSLCEALWGWLLLNLYIPRHMRVWGVSWLCIQSLFSTQVPRNTKQWFRAELLTGNVGENLSLGVSPAGLSTYFSG